MKKPFAFTLLTFIFTILLFELSFQLFVSEFRFLYQNHPSIGYIHTPNYQNDKNNKHKTKVTINSKSLRDKEYDYSRNNKKRILVLGDSFTEALQVNIHSCYTELLEISLDSAEVINCGHSGYGTKQERLFLESEGLRYAPDLVILQFFTGNDYQDNINPNYSVVNGYLFTKSNSLFGNIKRFLTSQSFLYRFIVKSIKNNKLINRYVLKKKVSESPHFTALARKRISTRDKIKIDSTFSEIMKINKICEDNEIELFVLLIPDRVQIYPKYQVRLNEIVGTSLDYKKPNLILSDFLQKKKIPYIDLYPVFSTSPRNNIYLKKDGHLDMPGHQLTARTIREFLKENYGY